MSRIGNKTITIPAGVEINVAAGNEVTVKGPKGTLTRQFNPLVDIKVDGNEIKMQVSVGQKVIIRDYAGTTVKLEGEEYIVVRQDDILAIVE